MTRRSCAKDCAPSWVDERLEVIAAVDDGADAVRLAAALKADLVLIETPCATPTVWAPSGRLSGTPRNQGVVLTAHSSEEYIRAALQAGADGYLLKESSRAELLMAIESVLSGKRFISPAVSAHIVARYLDTRGPRVPRPAGSTS